MDNSDGCIVYWNSKLNIDKLIYEPDMRQFIPFIPELGCKHSTIDYAYDQSNETDEGIKHGLIFNKTYYP